MGNIGEIALTAAVGVLVASAAFRKGRLRKNLAIIRQYRPKHIAANLVVIALIGLTSWALLTAAPVFRKNPFLWVIAELFHAGNGDGQNNLIMSGLNWKWYAVIFLPVLAIALPQLAQAEEVQYRGRTRSWADGIWRSLRFGLAHLFMLIPFGVALALTWAGLFFTWMYFRGAARVPDSVTDPENRADLGKALGVRNSAIYHAAFNTTIVTMAFVSVLVAW
jgi:hypothetical protein